MYVATVDIGAEGLQVDRMLEAVALRAREEGRGLELEGVHLAGWIHPLGRDFEFRGRLETVVRLPCSRCLEPYRQHCSLPFDLIYRERVAGEPGGLPEPDDPGISFLEGGRIDLGKLALEQIHLAMPLKPLCRTDCPGLCPRCGAPRAQGACGCREESVDPRWAALQKLKKDL